MRGCYTVDVGAPVTVLLDAGNTILEIDYEVVGRALGVDAATARRAEHEARVRLDTPSVIERTDDAVRWWTFFSFIAEGCGVRDRAAIAEALKALGLFHAEHNLWSVPPAGVHDVLGRLRRDHRLGVVSNATSPVRPLLERLGLAGYFETITDSVTVGVEKPDPRIFLAACGAMGVEPEACVYVGDIYHVDVLGARAAGMTGVLLDPTGRRTEACPKIRSIAELPDWLNVEGSRPRG